MRVHRIQLSHENDISFELLDENDQPIPVVSGFMRHLRARGYSPNTLSAYVFDLLHFMSFLQEQQLTYQEFTPPHALTFLEYLNALPSRKQAQRLGLVLATIITLRDFTTHLSSTIKNLTHSAVTSFYQYHI